MERGTLSLRSSSSVKVSVGEGRVAAILFPGPKMGQNFRPVSSIWALLVLWSETLPKVLSSVIPIDGEPDFPAPTPRPLCRQDGRFVLARGVEKRPLCTACLPGCAPARHQARLRGAPAQRVQRRGRGRRERPQPRLAKTRSPGDLYSEWATLCFDEGRPQELVRLGR